MGSVSSSVVAAPTGVPTTKKVFNETIGVANTEQGLVVPANIIGYIIRVRDVGDLKLTHVSGESGTKFLTIPTGASHCDEHAYENLTLFFQSPTAGAIVEVVTWEII